MTAVTLARMMADAKRLADKAESMVARSDTVGATVCYIEAAQAYTAARAVAASSITKGMLGVMAMEMEMLARDVS